jgi:hypothetical protein
VAVAVAVVAVVAAVVRHPPAGAYLLVGLGPLVVGFERGVVLPVMRPNEALLALVVAALILHWALTGRATRARITAFDVGLVALALLSSALPLAAKLVRSGHLDVDDVLYGAVWWKYVALYAVVRCVVTTHRQVRVLVAVTLVTASVLGLVALAQSLNLAGAAHLVARVFPPAEGQLNNGRGAASIGNPIGFGVYQAIHMLVAAALLLRGHGPRLALAAAAGCCLLGALGSGQVTALVAIVVGAIALGWVQGRLVPVLRAGALALALGLMVAWPLVERRVDGLTGEGSGISSRQRAEIATLQPHDQPGALSEAALRSSWAVRVENLQRHFLPSLADPVNLAVGVSPQPRAEAPEQWREWVYIESGYVWLLWVGGVPLAAGFVGFVAVALATTRRLAARPDVRGALAAAAFAAVAVVGVVQAFDPHLTLRGSAHALYPLLALAMAGAGGVVVRLSPTWQEAA